MMNEQQYDELTNAKSPFDALFAIVECRLHTAPELEEESDEERDRR